MPVFDFLQKERAKCRIDDRVHWQYPMVFTREGQAFYRILLGHDDGIAIGKLQVSRGVRMMIRKRMRHEIELHLLKMVEKASRVANAGECVDAFSMEGSRILLECWIKQIPEHSAFQRHREHCLASNRRQCISGYDHSIHPIQTPCSLPKRSRGHWQAVADAAAAVDDCNFKVALKRIVLQTVITDDDVALRVSRNERLRGGNAITPDPDRATASSRQQYRLIARDFRQRSRRNRHGLAVTAIAPAHDARCIALRG